MRSARLQIHVEKFKEAVTLTNFQNQKSGLSDHLTRNFKQHPFISHHLKTLRDFMKLLYGIEKLKTRPILS